MTRGRQADVHWTGRDGTAGRQRLGRLTVQERQWLFLEGPDGPEPTWLWLSEQGLPLLPDRWNQVFSAANRRCEQMLLTDGEREAGRRLRAAEVRGKVPYATPHSTRHSMALYMLIVLNRLMEARYGLTAAGRWDFALLFGDPWFLVTTRRAHQSTARSGTPRAGH